ncbi:MAG: AlpA family phage regulatory protein [Desulfovibrio sp.]|nr:AlpA family phage regulatory protein [Desulfovibrio sp.]
MDTAQAIADFDPMLRAETVATLLGLSVKGLWNACWQGRFPRPIKLSRRWSAWRKSTVEAWIRAKEAEQDAGRPGPEAKAAVA